MRTGDIGNQLRIYSAIETTECAALLHRGKRHQQQSKASRKVKRLNLPAFGQTANAAQEGIQNNRQI
ncbi:hypothetical protein [Burkholderia metallica]|uniref:hypothetical protein n=1 Tax=Burkholderia metallica TaxID=488729 RepID=UPI00131AAB87|nr:hypothetical protein [Burkholderia metallica]